MGVRWRRCQHYASELNQRAKKFAIRVIRFFQDIPKTDEARILGKQLLRSGTSVAANYRAACRSRSQEEFFSKLCIVVEESDETLFWLELLTESGIVSEHAVSELRNEAEELLRIFSASRKTLKNKLDLKRTPEIKNQQINKLTNQ